MMSKIKHTGLAQFNSKRNRHMCPTYWSQGIFVPLFPCNITQCATQDQDLNVITTPLWRLTDFLRTLQKYTLMKWHAKASPELNRAPR